MTDSQDIRRGIDEAALDAYLKTHLSVEITSDETHYYVALKLKNEMISRDTLPID